MKKFLALVLALVMTMSLVTISAGAADFTDDASITYEEAVDVMTAIGVVGGYADGSFNPTGTLTRGAAAKIICNMILGPTEAGALATVEAPFKDVPADHVFAGYIAYCASEGIVGGYTDGTFRPAGTLTGYAFWKMLLGALGYEAGAEGYTGTNYAINVAKRGLNIGLNKGLEGDFAGAKALTREEACLYAFNTLKANMVEYDSNSSITIGDIVISNNSKAEEIDNTAGDYRVATGYNASTDDTKLQFCEQYFKKLALDASATDAFGRTSNYWKNDKTDIGKYAATATFTYTSAQKAADLAKELKGYKVTLDGTTYVAVDNVAGNANTTALPYILNNDTTATGATTSLTTAGKLADLTGNGVKVELFADSDKQITKIVVIEEALYQITDIDLKNKDVTLTEKTSSVIGTLATIDEDADCYEALAAMAEDDYVLVTASKNTSGTYDVVTVEKVEGITGAVTKKVAAESVTLGGEVYKFAKNENAVSSMPVDKDTDKVLFLDSYGYAIWTTSTSAATSKDVIYLTAKYNGTGDWGATNMIQGVLADGTVVTAEYVADAFSGTDVNYGSLSLATAYEYAKDGEKYSLSTGAGSKTAIGTAAVGGSDTVADEDKKLTVSTTWDNYFAADVKFVYVSGNKSDLKVTVKEGVQDVSLAATDYVVVAEDADGNKVITAVFVAAVASTSSDDVVFVATALTPSSYKSTGYGLDGKTAVYGYELYINGEKKVVDFASTQTKSVGFYTYTVDDVTGAYTLTAAPTNVANGIVSSVDYVGGVYYINGVSAIAGFDATKAEIVNTLATGATVETMADLKDTGASDTIYVVYDADAKTVDMIYVYAEA